MRGYFNRSEIRMFAISAIILAPVAILCYQQELSLGTISSIPLFFMLLAMLVTCNIEIPISEIRTRKNKTLERDALVLEEIYSVPLVEEISSATSRVFNTIVTFNVGGFLIPLGILLYLIITQINFAALEIMLIIIVAVTLLSEIVDGIGIVIPSYIGIIAIPFSLIFDPNNAALITFVAGTGGIMIGTLTTLLTLDKEKNGSAYINIGGAGNFKAIYITTMIAALISYFT